MPLATLDRLDTLAQLCADRNVRKGLERFEMLSWLRRRQEARRLAQAVALIVAKRTGHKIGLDTATRMLARNEARKL